ncbi:indolepyruvate ferredoxin oxidoreductase beta subunit [Alkaliphilus peptidifermentans DSM 18978]|uniref:Indolepyruvate ferredoxin oxidoreductase beta subunit n=1 Tax=Alkaliphilus peptidifermentans DSM 18978 TaxID=1120976 RepID=A0A1G5J2I9_9FIRM|nr:indolepyruvate oxidoreductase subunit beta [Alkaliphilus peptidifermentans]SCY82545.1 indolepyruvate ferredoxin oxidoreductase beta subunit [Alkaliphilus peptidifermentans DSM 18978]
MTTNIMLGGVGGQGLILMTKIICQAALADDFDVKSNDVVGLSQRGGMVWGNVRIGNRVYSPNIPPGEGDILVAMEPIEGLRWSSVLKEKATIILNSKRFYPTMVQQEKHEYPIAEVENLKEAFKVIEINAFDEALKIGKKQVSNVILLGILSVFIDIKVDTWKKAVANNVPNKTIEMNLRAFDFGVSIGEGYK